MGEALSFSCVVFLICLGGALGGAAELCRRFAISDGAVILIDHQSSPEGVPALSSFNSNRLFGLLLISVIVGICGALSIQFILVMLDAAKLDNTTTHKLFLLSISAGAGFGARQLLVKIASKLEEQVEDAKNSADEANTKASEAIAKIEESARRMMDESQFSNQVDSVIRKQADPGTVNHVMHKLKLHIADDPLYGGYAIPYAYLLREKDPAAALAVTESFLEAKEKKGEASDAKYASALYNKACFHVLLNKGVDTDDGLKAVIAQLRKAVELDPENWSYILVDTDLDKIRDSDQFKAFIAGKPDWAGG